MSSEPDKKLSDEIVAEMIDILEGIATVVADDSYWGKRIKQLLAKVHEPD
jgi:hypothetical protein